MTTKDIFTKMTKEQEEELAKNPYRAVESFWYGVFAMRPLDRDMGIDIKQNPEVSEQIGKAIDQINLAVKELEKIGYFIGTIQVANGVGQLADMPEKVGIMTTSYNVAFGSKGGKD